MSPTGEYQGRQRDKRTQKLHNLDLPLVGRCAFPTTAHLGIPVRLALSCRHHINRSTRETLCVTAIQGNGLIADRRFNSKTYSADLRAGDEEQAPVDGVEDRLDDGLAHVPFHQRGTDQTLLSLGSYQSNPRQNSIEAGDVK